MKLKLVIRLLPLVLCVPFFANAETPVKKSERKTGFLIVLGCFAETIARQIRTVSFLRS